MSDWDSVHYPTDEIHSVRRNPTTKSLLRLAETSATALRTLAGNDEMEPLQPRRLAKQLGIEIVDLASIGGSKQDLELLSVIDASAWSGAGLPLPDGKILIILNPNQTTERANVTIMEEVAHHHLNHFPSQLIKEPSGVVRRVYSAQIEQEAYWTAAAALLPAKVVARAVWRRTSSEVLSYEYGVSDELIRFRVKTLGLWKDFDTRSRGNSGNQEGRSGW